MVLHRVIFVLAALALCPAAAGAQASRPTVTPVRAYRSTPARRPVNGDPAALLKVPSGLEVTVFARGLGAPRMLALGDDGTVYVTRRDSKRRARARVGSSRSPQRDRVGSG
jgi:glucose/arabinose dehydrogenase